VKYLDYLKYGVKEYWVVNPDIRIIDVYLLEDGKYVSRNFVAGEIIDAGMFAADGIPVDLIYDRNLSVMEFMNHQRNT
jgi:Uma2 family endonuclease